MDADTYTAVSHDDHGMQQSGGPFTPLGGDTMAPRSGNSFSTEAPSGQRRSFQADPALTRSAGGNAARERAMAAFSSIKPASNQASANAATGMIPRYDIR